MQTILGVVPLPRPLPQCSSDVFFLLPTSNGHALQLPEELCKCYLQSTFQFFIPLAICCLPMAQMTYSTNDSSTFQYPNILLPPSFSPSASLGPFCSLTLTLLQFPQAPLTFLPLSILAFLLLLPAQVQIPHLSSPLLLPPF